MKIYNANWLHVLLVVILIGGTFTNNPAIVRAADPLSAFNEMSADFLGMLDELEAAKGPVAVKNAASNVRDYFRAQLRNISQITDADQARNALGLLGRQAKSVSGEGFQQVICDIGKEAAGKTPAEIEAMLNRGLPKYPTQGLGSLTNLQKYKYYLAKLKSALKYADAEEIAGVERRLAQLRSALTPDELAEINKPCTEPPVKVKPPPPVKPPIECPPGTTPKIVQKPPSTTLGSGAGSLQAVYERVVLNASQHTGVRAAFRATVSSGVKYGKMALRLVGRGTFALLEILNPAGWVLLAGDFANFLVDQWNEQTLRADIEMARQVTVDAAENDLTRIERLWPQYLEELEKEVQARACAQPTAEYTKAQQLLTQMLRFKMDYIEQQSRRYAVLLWDIELKARQFENRDYLVSQQEALAEVIRGNIERDGNRIRAFSADLFSVVFEEKFEGVRKLILEKSLTIKPSCNGEDIVCEKDDGNGGGGGGGGGAGSAWDISGEEVCNFPIIAYTDRGEEKKEPMGSQSGFAGQCIVAVQCCAMARCAPGPYANVWGLRLRNGRVVRIWGCNGLPRELPEGACRQPEFTNLEMNALCNESEQEWPPALRARVAALEQAANRELTGSAGSAAGGAIGSVTRSDKSLAELFRSSVSSPGTFLRALLKNRL